MSTEAMKLALEALETYYGYMEPLTTVFGGPRVPAEQSTTSKVETAIASLHQAIAEAEKQEQGEPDYKALWQQMCERCDELDAKLVKQEQQVVSLQCANCQVTIETLNDKVMSLLAKQEQPKVRTGNCLLTGVCASEGHKIQPKQEQGEVEHEQK